MTPTMKAHTLNAEPNHVPVTVMVPVLGCLVPRGASVSTNDWTPPAPPLFTLAESAKRAREDGGGLSLHHRRNEVISLRGYIVN